MHWKPNVKKCFTIHIAQKLSFVSILLLKINKPGFTLNTLRTGLFWHLFVSGVFAVITVNHSNFSRLSDEFFSIACLINVPVTPNSKHLFGSCSCAWQIKLFYKLWVDCVQKKHEIRALFKSKSSTSNCTINLLFIYNDRIWQQAEVSKSNCAHIFSILKDTEWDVFVCAPSIILKQTSSCVSYTINCIAQKYLDVYIHVACAAHHTVQRWTPLKI